MNIRNSFVCLSYVS